MTIIPSALITLWRTASNDLNNDLGVTCTLVFDSGFTEVSNISQDLDGLKQKVVMPYGGRGRGFSTPGHNVMSPNVVSVGNHIQSNEINKDITARVYAIAKDFEKYGIQVSANTNVYEVITRKIFIPDLQRAKHIILFTNLPERRIKAKLIRIPIPYGLGGAYNCRSFWQETIS